MRMSPRKGFTLVEVLIVIAIIILLTAILFPVLMSARRSGQWVACQSNLRQLGLAFMLYAEEHDDAFPNTGNTLLWMGRNWRPVIDGYVGNKKMYWCPADGVSERQYDSTSFAYLQSFYHSDDDITAGAAGMFTPTLQAYHTCGTTTKTRVLSEVAFPAEKILIYEWLSNHEPPLRTMWDADGAHNALCVDGHVVRVKQEKLNLSALGDHDPNWTNGGLKGKDIP